MAKMIPVLNETCPQWPRGLKSMQEPNGNSPGAVGHIPEAREVRQCAELNVVFGNLQRGNMFMNDIFSSGKNPENPLCTCVRTAAIPMRQEATPRKRNFREMAALLELCGVRSGGRVTTILKKMVYRFMHWLNRLNITSCLRCNNALTPFLSAL